LESDQELLDFILNKKPAIVSIDSPLGFPGGGSEIDPSAGIVRVAEHDLSSVGIPAYPALIDSMKELTSRGVRLRKMIEAFEEPPIVIESYPGAAQDVLCIPRKQKSLELLRDGLRELGITGPGLLTDSHDEMDAITSAVVGRFYETGEYLPMGIPSEAQLIVPRIRPLRFDVSPIICLAGKTGAGKSVVARYLALFYGFRWIRTRNLIHEILIEDCKVDRARRMYPKDLAPDTITDQHLRDFGVMVLEKYQQKPLRNKLRIAIHKTDEALVVDSIRDIADLNISDVKRPIYIWFIECADSLINNRLAEKSKVSSFKGRSATYPIDQNIATLREHSDFVLLNASTLEDLRWKIDDALFSILSFSNSSDHIDHVVK
jgi:predicted nuclease with RNAse H fold/dephospho-CoA kinase